MLGRRTIFPMKDPRRPGRDKGDRLWFGETCSPFFRRGRRWNLAKMERHNPLWLIRRTGSQRLKDLRRTKFHIHSVESEEHGNIDRARALITALNERDIETSFEGDDIILDPAARHTWKWADVHLERTLPLHDAVFRS